MHVGRRVDNFVREFIVAGSYAKKDTTPAINRRVATVLNALSQRGIRPCAAQVLVVDRSIQLMSYIDAVGLDTKGDIWSIELKCTTDSVAAHEQLYNKPASKSERTLLNGMADTERHHHFLQSAFGAYAMRQTYKSIQKVRPCVIVCCTDGVRFYEVPPHFCNPLAFTAPNCTVAPKALKTTKKIATSILRPWPHDVSGIEPLIRGLGYTKIEHFCKGVTESGVAVLKPARKPVGSCGVAICLHSRWSRLSLQAKRNVLKTLEPAIEYVKKKMPKDTLILQVVFAPSCHGQWEVAFLKKALLGTPTI